MKEFRKSVYICGSCDQKSTELFFFFDSQCNDLDNADNVFLAKQSKPLMAALNKFCEEAMKFGVGKHRVRDDSDRHCS